MPGSAAQERRTITASRLVVSALTLAGLACGRPGITALDPPGNPTGTTAEAADPALARDPVSGDLLLAWVGGAGDDWSLYFARSADSGRTWSAPVPVTHEAGEVAPHGEASPRLVATGGGVIAIAWVRNVPVSGRPWPASVVRLTRSTDGGIHWDIPVTLNDDSTSGPTGHNFHGAAWAGDSGLVVAWLDERGGGSAVSEGHRHGGNTPPENAGDETSEPDAAIYLASSADGGRTWSPNRRLWPAVCPCCRVTLARGPDGAVRSAWRRHYPGNVRDVVVAPLPADDALSEPSRIHHDAWVYPGCPHAGPGAAVDAQGRMHVAWYTGGNTAPGLYYERLDASGAPGGNPVALLAGDGIATTHASVGVTDDAGAVVTWDRLEDGGPGVSLAWIDAAGRLAAIGPVPGGAEGGYPQVVTSGNDRVLLAWTVSGPGGPRVNMGWYGRADR